MVHDGQLRNGQHRATIKGMEDKTPLLRVRLEQSLRDLLDAAIVESGRSLNAEINYRLRRSFDDPVMPAIDVQRLLLKKGKTNSVTVGGNAIREPLIDMDRDSLESAIMRQLRALPPEKRALVLSILKLVA